jgi:PAS domain S-box-containing protein
VPTGAVTWSKGIDALFGLPPGGFAGTYEAYLALVHPDDRAHFQALIARTLAGEDEYVMTHRVLWPDGVAHWIDGRGRLTRDAEGRPLQLDGMVWDAKARKRAEARVLHLQSVQAVASAVTKELLRVESDADAFDHACRIAVEHGHFKFAWVGLVSSENARVVPAARAGVEEGYLAEIVVTADLRDTGRGPVGRAIREGRSVAVNDVAKDPTFAPWCERALRRGYHGCAAFPLRRCGEVIGALSIYAGEADRFDAPVLDMLDALADDIGITLDAIDEAAHRRAAEEAARRSEERFRALFEQASDAIFIFDRDDRIVDANRAACDMTGYSRDELMTKSVEDLLGADFTRSKARGGRDVEEVRLKQKSGASIDAEVSATALEHGRLQAHVRDVTLRKRVQQQLILADRLASLGRLAAGVAHEVNNPLAYVSLNLERVQRALAKETAAHLVDLREAADDALDGAQRVREVVRALGTLGRDGDGQVGPIDLHRVLDTAIRLTENQTRHRAKLVKDYQAKRNVRGNELRLAQVFVNLLLNAADALKEDAVAANTITVRSFDEGPTVVVEVRDNGAGISQEIIGKIFDPFFTTKNVGAGTGLGLAISYSILGSFGGSIAVESTVGAGSVFRVTLIAESVDATPKSTPIPGHAAKVTKRARVLVVDDEPRIVEIVASALEDHDVTVATTGAAALALCATSDFDCVFCDLMMPGLGGIEFHAELERDKPSIATRVVFMTGGAFTTRARDFVRATPNVVLQKPFTTARLLQALAAVLSRKPA